MIMNSDREAIVLVKEVRKLCKSGNIHLHKFIGNNKYASASLPKKECAGEAIEFDPALVESKTERALGVQTRVTSDKFHLNRRTEYSHLVDTFIQSDLHHLHSSGGICHAR